MIKIEEITDMKYDYEHMYLINPFNFQNLLQTSFLAPYTFRKLFETFEASCLKPFVLKFQFFMEKRELFFTTTTSEYLKFIDKIYNKTEIKCHLCKSNSKYYCGFCQEFFCSSCFDNHSQQCDKYIHFIKRQSQSGIRIKNNINYIDNLNKKIGKENSKFLINNNPMDWKHCNCNEKRNIIYCEHGIRCENCHCNKCNNDYEVDNFKFINLETIFLKYESKFYNEIKYLEKDINEFNENIATLFIKNKDKIENEARKKRFIKHFMYLRNNFIAYQKLKIIIYNIIKKNQDMSLFKLYTYFRDYKLCFKKFIYLTNLSPDKNISRLSNFFASQNPIFLKEDIDDYVNVVDEYLKLENNEVKSNENNKKEDNKEKKEENKEKKEELPKCKLEIKSNEINNIKSYIDSTNIFKFYDDNKRNIYSIRFYSDFSKEKMGLLYNENNNTIMVNCKPMLKLKNGKWFFYFVNNYNNHWISLLKEDEINSKIFSIQMVEAIDASFKFEVFELINDKFLIYESGENLEELRGRINIINSKDCYMNQTIFIPFDKPGIEKLYYLEKYKNIVFVSLFKPLLKLLTIDFELNQINSIIELTEPIYIPKDFYYFRPYIRDIKSIKNNKLLIIGGQHLEFGYRPSYLLQYYKFNIIYNLDNFQIECADHYEGCVRDGEKIY